MTVIADAQGNICAVARPPSYDEKESCFRQTQITRRKLLHAEPVRQSLPSATSRLSIF